MGIFDSKEEKAIDREHEKALDDRLKDIDKKYDTMTGIKNDVERRTEKLRFKAAHTDKDGHGVGHREVKAQEVAFTKGMDGIQRQKEKDVLKENAAYKKQEETLKKPHEKKLEKINSEEAKALKELKGKKDITREDITKVGNEFSKQRETLSASYGNEGAKLKQGHEDRIDAIRSNGKEEEKLRNTYPQGAAEWDKEEAKRNKQAQAAIKPEGKAAEKQTGYSTAVDIKDMDFEAADKAVSVRLKEGKGAFVETKSADGKSVTYTDPTVYKELEAKIKDGSLNDKEKEKLAANIITHTLDDQGKVTNIQFGKEVKAVGKVDGHIVQIQDGKVTQKSSDNSQIPVRENLTLPEKTVAVRENLTMPEAGTSLEQKQGRAKDSQEPPAAQTRRSTRGDFPQETITGKAPFTQFQQAATERGNLNTRAPVSGAKQPQSKGVS